MKNLNNYLKRYKKAAAIVVSALALFTITGCQTAQNENVRVQVVNAASNIPLQTRPREIQVESPNFFVLTKDNFDEFERQYMQENGDFVLYVISPKDYKSLFKSLADVKRYIDQQNEIIFYYEESIKAADNIGQDIG